MKSLADRIRSGVYRPTIFVKLILLYIAITLVSFLLISAISSFMFQQRLQGDVYRNVAFMQSNIIRYIDNAHAYGWDRDTLLASIALSTIHRDSVHLVYNAKGELLYQIGSSGGPGGEPALSSSGASSVIAKDNLARPRPLRPERAVISDKDIGLVEQSLIQEALGGHAQSVEVTGSGGDRLLLYASPINLGGDGDEKVIVTLFGGYQRSIMLFTGPSMLSLLFAFPVAAIMFYYFSRRLTKPLKAMNRTALRFAKGDFQDRVAVPGRDEVGQLGHTLNYMADELSSLDRMRQEFLANVSHDMRAPLASINGFAAALIDGTIPEARKPHYLNMIRESSLRMMKLVEDLLDVARIEGNQFPVEPAPFNLHERIRQTAAHLEPLLLHYQIPLQVDSPEQDIWVVADSYRIDQVLTNLLHNAIYHSPPNGEISVSCLLNTSNEAVVSVCDQGSGMSPEQIQHMWDRFYKGDKARRARAGTGIGLSIVKHILDKHGSKVQVISSPGQGTTVTFTLDTFN
ncbi:sensor histidine kinase [Paenibacillus sp. CAU 1782]